MPDPTRTKFTVYLSEADLLGIDADILDLRGRYGIKLDRSAYATLVLGSVNVADVAALVVEGEA